MDPAELEMTRAHDAARKFTESKIAQLSKPKLGQKPLTPEQIEAQAAVLRSALRTKHAAEVEALRVRLAAVVVAAAAAASVPTDSIPPGDAPHGESLATPETTPSCETSSATQSAPITSSDQQQQQPRQEASPLPTPSLITAPASTNLKTVAASVAISATAAAVSAADAGGPKKSRAKRREEKKMEEKHRASAERAVEDVGASQSKPPKVIELEALRAQLVPLGFGIRLVPADGNCLFRSVADQLYLLGEQYGASQGSNSGTVTPTSGSAPAEHAFLRRRAADYILKHSSEFAPYLPYEKSDAYPDDSDARNGTALEAATRAAVAKYCARMADTSCWGGHPEIRALACSLGLPIELFMAGSPPVEFTPEGAELRGAAGDTAAAWPDSAKLRLTYHRHYYALGEHYNSVSALAASSDSSAADLDADGDGAGWLTK